MLEINNRIKLIQIILFALKVSQMMMQKLSGEKVRIMILSIVKLSPMEQIMHITSANDSNPTIFAKGEVYDDEEAERIGDIDDDSSDSKGKSDETDHGNLHQN